MSVTVIDNQPISATFFNAGKWLTEFVTPGNLQVQDQTSYITQGLDSIDDRVRACQVYVGGLKYKPYISGTVNIAGHVSAINDLWCNPEMTIMTGVGNCANKSFLLTSMLRNFMDPESVHCVLGNLYNGHASGHAWVETNINGISFVVEATRPDVPPVPAAVADHYEAVHYFNDQAVMAVEGRTTLKPITACYSTWLKDYLDWSYIHQGGQ